MKLQLLKVSKDQISSFSARQDTTPNTNNRWHYHPEIELVYFKKGQGTQFIGDSISPFLPGDVVLVGADTPHYWQFDLSGENVQDGLSADVSVIHFNELFWGETFLKLPENKIIGNIFEKSKRGISLSKSSGRKIGPLIEKIVTAEGCRKIILLLEVLLAIGECKESKLLASIGFRNNFQEEEKDRINAIYNYSINNFKKNISLKEISTVANISPNSFCKFFKSRSRKTYSQFIREIRIGHACKLLIDDKLAIKEICYESGFNNFTSFHKHFKMIKGKTPLGYQKSFVRDSL
ncbi:MAG: transcriptional regulator [Mucilaginibacter sp.]|uniref:AraC family transcriptional regulator n=1 Tax=Mucilaginibacter sp. TaxID=1882438 RepID=UPI002607878B|nr:AraC family transcriptional regulator [Mucilaginibacter sp.]MDB5003300.1 transcriptional regulator [Mucilaginibacter sp.]